MIFFKQILFENLEKYEMRENMVCAF